MLSCEGYTPMPEAVIAELIVPRKPVVSADDSVQSVLLTLVVSDHESVAELLQKTEGRERDEYALTSLRIGILALKHARGQIDAAERVNEFETGGVRV